MGDLRPDLLEFEQHRLVQEIKKQLQSELAQIERALKAIDEGKLHRLLEIRQGQQLDRQIGELKTILMIKGFLEAARDGRILRDFI